MDDLVLCGESEEDIRSMVGSFAEVCWRRGFKGKGMALNRAEELERES